MNDYVENIYIENTRCYKIIGKSIEKHELYVLNPYVEEHLVGTFISYEEALKAIEIRRGRRMKK